jgi:thioredoxin 1
MKRRDLALIALVLGVVAVVAALRTAPRPAAPTLAPSGAAAARAEPPEPRTAALSLPRMVDIGAGRCIPCKKMAPILAELRAEYAGRAEVVFIDVWERPELADGYRFRAIPTQIFYDRVGREVWRHEDFLGKSEIVAQFRAMGVE